MRATNRILATAACLFASLVATAGPVSAACHVAAFSVTESTVAESDGQVTLLVFLQGRQPSCEGTIDFATADGTAVAGEDYEATQGTLEFVADDDREEQVVVPILEDDVEEGDETFTISLSNPTGGISGSTTPATITITDAAAGSSATSDDVAPDEPAEDPGATNTPDPPADDEDTDPGEDASEQTDGSGGLVVAIVAALIAIGGGGWFVYRRRQG